ncbi:MAG: hypothetical protein WB795_04700 [Candidatus Acidiferrales bacterium]|jgi:hypothetical protein
MFRRIFPSRLLRAAGIAATAGEHHRKYRSTLGFGGATLGRLAMAEVELE